MACPPDRLAQLKQIDPSIPDAQWHAQCDEEEGVGGFSQDCPPDRPFKTGRAVAGGQPADVCVEKRENCPPGFRVHGETCYPESDPRFGGEGGEGGGPGGPGGEGGPGGGGPGGGGYDEMTQMAMSQLYGMPYLSPMEGALHDYYAGIMGKKWNPETGEYEQLGSTGQLAAATGAEQQAIRESVEGQIQQVMATMPPGGERDKIIGDLRKQQQGLAAQSRQGAIQQATAGLSDLYGRRLDVAGNVLGQGTQRFGITTGAETERRGQDVSERIARMQDATQRMLGGGELGLARERFGWETGTRFPWEQAEAAANRKLQGAGMKQQAQASRRGFWGSLAGGLLGAGGSLFSGRFGRSS